MACYCTLTLSMSLSSGNNQLYYKCRILLHNMLHKMGQSCFISVIQLHLSALHQISFIKFMTGNNVRVMLLMRTALWIKSVFGCFTLTSCCSYLIYSWVQPTSDSNMNLLHCGYQKTWRVATWKVIIFVANTFICEHFGHNLTLKQMKAAPLFTMVYMLHALIWRQLDIYIK